MTGNTQGTGSSEPVDVLIVGGGPAGLFAAFYAGLRGLSVKIIEALEELGGQLAVLYPEKYIFDVAGFPKILARDLALNLVEQASQYSPEIVLGERVTHLEKLEERLFRLTTDKGATHTGKVVIITAGVGAFSPNKVNNPSVDKFEGRGVYYFVKEKSAFKDKRLMIVGGGDSALDWVFNLKETARSVMLVHRRDVFRAHEDSVKKLFASGIPVKLFYEIRELRGNAHVESAVIFNNKTGEEEEYPVDAVLLNLGFRADVGPIKNWGLEMDGRYIKVNGRMETSVPGVYAAGDIASDVHSVNLNLIVVAFGQSAIAVNCAANYINPKASVFPGHSSEMSK
ncbi:MAG: NAD(P)/FAD-dependent oxidoreductase [bacterium JZ-2024 1]